MHPKRLRRLGARAYRIFKLSKWVRYGVVGVFAAGVLSSVLYALGDVAKVVLAIFALNFGGGTADATPISNLQGCVRASDTCTLYGASQSSNNLYTVDPETGATLSFVAMTVAEGKVSKVFGLAANPVTNELWALVKVGGRGGGGFVRYLAKVDPLTGVITVVGGTGNAFAGLAIDRDGTFFAVTGDGGEPPETLFTLDPTSAVAAQVCALGNGDAGETLAFNPLNGFVYHGSGAEHAVLERIDDASSAHCTETDIPLSGASVGQFRGLTFDPATGLFLHTDGSVFVSIALDGVVTLLGNAVDARKGLAFVKN